jgi:hypothetical protein
MFNVEHWQTVNGGGLGAHPIVVNHEGSLSGNHAYFIVETSPHSGGSRLPATCCSHLLMTMGA